MPRKLTPKGFFTIGEFVAKAKQQGIPTDRSEVRRMVLGGKMPGSKRDKNHGKRRHLIPERFLDPFVKSRQEAVEVDSLRQRLGFKRPAFHKFLRVLGVKTVRRGTKTLIHQTTAARIIKIAVEERLSLKNTISTVDAGQALGLSRGAVERRIKKGLLPGGHIKGKIRVSKFLFNIMWQYWRSGRFNLKNRKGRVSYFASQYLFLEKIGMIFERKIYETRERVANARDKMEQEKALGIEGEAIRAYNEIIIETHRIEEELDRRRINPRTVGNIVILDAAPPLLR